MTRCSRSGAALMNATISRITSSVAQGAPDAVLKEYMVWKEYNGGFGMSSARAQLHALNKRFRKPFYGMIGLYMKIAFFETDKEEEGYFSRENFPPAKFPSGGGVLLFFFFWGLK